jgi:hypothetical protein
LAVGTSALELDLNVLELPIIERLARVRAPGLQLFCETFVDLGVDDFSTAHASEVRMRCHGGVEVHEPIRPREPEDEAGVGQLPEVLIQRRWTQLVSFIAERAQDVVRCRVIDSSGEVREDTEASLGRPKSFLSEHVGKMVLFWRHRLYIYDISSCRSTFNNRMRVIWDKWGPSASISVA